jgi:cobalt-zinc-cadmium resistance protein CzcA
MLKGIIKYSIHHKLIVLLFTGFIVAFGLYSLFQIPIGAVPDITNNQVQIITTSRNLATEEVEQFLTYPVELEMANLPGVKEIRSISKFGLSVVTVVFDDALGTYLPRQLIAEKIKSAEEKIPQGFGSPFMGPISTGLGEIYQYIIDVDPKYKARYSLTDLRTLQDWVVKRQLSGIPGVVEVNTWGGHLKTYEIALNPTKLKALQVSVNQVYEALKLNNSVAGGSYIEKTNESYFIRGEGLLNSFEDINAIVVAKNGVRPILIKDIATVQFGHANRFGAITGNGQGEKVLGQIMMLKDADSNRVIQSVKERVAEIQKNLPEGVFINPFLERSELIEKTTETIIENLLIGCIIVVLIVILLLGNLRSGLIVASVIPLSLLFALSLMYLFDVDSNLMSLGAIDFGIIIDGAVIIVEFIAFTVVGKQAVLLSSGKEERRKLMDEITYTGATKMMNSAVFGQLIIILVFIPIFSLTSVEGKMFRPMAQVFCFALLGAMILCFTYIPVITSLVLSSVKQQKKSISSRLIQFLEQKYKPLLTWALHRKKVVLGGAIGFFLIAVIVFQQMGGEFVPTLDEGDFVIQPVLKTGTTLSKTIELTTQMEEILLTFPEVDQVVTRIGAAEVPTDPMSMEESDVIITLHPKSEWTTTSTKDDLANHFKKALSVIPGVDFEFTQPIEMRFNELITGVRADLAIKIFGEDLNLLTEKALEIEAAIQGIEGAADITVEKTAGLPQMNVRYDRQKIAKYGLSVDALNQLVTVGFAGVTAGTIFEGEKQFDLVLRYDQAYRNTLEDLQSTSFLLPNGTAMPLKEFATVEYTQGPAKISRDNTKRRIVVGVNVRNRDLESVVQDVQRIIESKITLPTGYTIEYGGQFENLRAATKRLQYAVPISLFLIFIMLYFAFHSVREALLIYSAIPLSAIGGILALWLRGIPFSISAGVGFIALFGIAVLNGIVLIEEFKALKKEGILDLKERIVKATQNRMRPVLLTASAAALGFLPMAVSSSAGAEVQRPLATVVIGGLLSATILTLLVLPVLYTLFESPTLPKRKGKNSTLLFVLAFPLFSTALNAQSKIISAEDAVRLALENNRGLRAEEMRVQQLEQLEGTSFDLDKTQFYYSFDENNLDPRGFPLKVFGINQSLEFPTIYGAKKKVNKQKTAVAESYYAVQKNTITKGVLKAYYNVVTAQLIAKEYRLLDSLFSKASQQWQKNFALGGLSVLEKLNAEVKQNEISRRYFQAKEAVYQAQIELGQWIQNDSISLEVDKKLPLLEWNPIQLNSLPGFVYYKEVQQLSEKELQLEKQNWLPNLTAGYFQGSDSQPNSPRFDGIELGISLPLWTGATQSKIKAARLQTSITSNELENYTYSIKTKYQKLLSELISSEVLLTQYEKSDQLREQELEATAQKSFLTGGIGLLDYVNYIEVAKSIKIEYLKNINSHNSIVIELNYLTE